MSIYSVAFIWWVKIYSFVCSHFCYVLGDSMTFSNRNVSCVSKMQCIFENYKDHKAKLYHFIFISSFKLQSRFRVIVFFLVIKTSRKCLATFLYDFLRFIALYLCALSWRVDIHSEWFASLRDRRISFLDLYRVSWFTNAATIKYSPLLCLSYSSWEFITM